MELPSINEFYVTVGRELNGVYYDQEAFIVEVNMLQPGTAFMTLTPFRAECYEEDIDQITLNCPNANDPAFDPNDNPDFSQSCSGSWDKEVCEDRRIGNIIKLRV